MAIDFENLRKLSNRMHNGDNNNEDEGEDEDIDNQNAPLPLSLPLLEEEYVKMINDDNLQGLVDKQNEIKNILVIVESPKKTKSLEKYLNKIAAENTAVKTNYVVIATMGHIADLVSQKHTNQKYSLGIDLMNGYEPLYKVVPTKINQLQIIINAASVSNKILMATDDDREGECIASLVADRLATCRKPISRIKFTEITETGVRNALKNETVINMQLVQAAKARRVLDRFAGYLTSPAAISALGKGLSAGRVQSVALRFIVEREREIQNFVSEKYYTVKGTFSENNVSFDGILSVKKKRGGGGKKTKENKESNDVANADDGSNRLTDKEFVKKLCSNLQNSQFTVDKIVKKPKNRDPIPPLNTAQMQIIAGSKCGFSPTDTMTAAQHLYENGKITYHRTDSVRISDEALDSVRVFIKSNFPDALPSKPNVYKTKDSAQNAHEGIRPTNVNLIPVKNPVSHEDKLYRLIWEIFVASQMKPAVYDTVSVTISANDTQGDLGNVKYEFKANGRVLSKPGWLALADNSVDLSDGSSAAAEVDDSAVLASHGGGGADKLLPNMVEKNPIKCLKVFSEEKHTSPPSRYKQPTLTALLESRGIGRPSTYAPIVDKLFLRKYVELKKDYIIPTELGISLVDFLLKYFSFMDYDFTANMELKLDAIERGAEKYYNVVHDFYSTLVFELEQTKKDGLGEEAVYCKKCGAVMHYITGPSGGFLGCTAYPNCKNTIAVERINGKYELLHKPVDFVPGMSCPVCRGKITIRWGQFGAFYACERYPLCKYTKKIVYQDKKCPNCSGDLYKTYWGREPYNGAVLLCSSYPGCQYREHIDDPEFVTQVKLHIERQITKTKVSQNNLPYDKMIEIIAYINKKKGIETPTLSKYRPDLVDQKTDPCDK